VLGGVRGRSDVVAAQPLLDGEGSTPIRTFHGPLLRGDLATTAAVSADADGRLPGKPFWNDTPVVIVLIG
jgi:hypothetical protein